MRGWRKFSQGSGLGWGPSEQVVSNKNLSGDCKSNRGEGLDPIPGSAHEVLVNLLLRRLWHGYLPKPHLLIPTFHWTTFPLRSWRSRSFSKIIPNRSRSVDSHTIWGLHASSTFPLRFCYASVTLLPRCSRFGCVVIALLLRSRYDNEDPATLRVR